MSVCRIILDWLFWIYFCVGDFAHLSGFRDFKCLCILILWHVYFGDVWIISAATVDNFINACCMIFVDDVASISWINVLFACFIALIEVGRYNFAKKSKSIALKSKGKQSQAL